jgi:membrane-associated phospholipid phosphatase
VAGANDVAAMPSLHSAIPFVMMFALWKYRGLRWAGVAFAASMPFAVVYLGEHYFVDALGGLGVAAVGWLAAKRLVPWLASRSANHAAVQAQDEPLGVGR